MSKSPLIVVTAIALTLGIVAAFAGAGPPSHSHESFSAGEPGNPKKPARIVQVTMREGDGKMLFIPDRIDIRKGEQIHFIIRNNGLLKHEFTLASVQDRFGPYKRLTASSALARAACAERMII